MSILPDRPFQVLPESPAPVRHVWIDNARNTAARTTRKGQIVAIGEGKAPATKEAAVSAPSGDGAAGGLDLAQSVALPQGPAPEWVGRSFRAFAERLRDHPRSRSSNESDRWLG